MNTDEIKEIWDKVLAVLKEKIPSVSYETWVLPLVPFSFDADKFILLSPHNFTEQTLKISYGKLITETISTVVGTPVNYEIVYDKNLEEKFEKAGKKLVREEKKATAFESSGEKYDILKQMHSDCRLNTKYTFDNFVVGAYNKIAYGAAFAVASGKSDKKFNPLYIYGGSGLGKTHLLYAIGNYVMSKRSNIKVRYVTSEEFLLDVLSAINKGIDKDALTRSDMRNKAMIRFREKYRNTDLLLVDDIQLATGKERMQEEIFKMFDALYQNGKQIVLTSDCLPSEIPNLSDRLKTRFAWGLTVDIGTPDIETRMAILQKLAEQRNLKLSLEIIEFLAGLYKNNIRELEGAFNRVDAYCEIIGEKPSLDAVKRAINYDNKKSAVTVASIVKAVGEFYDIPSSEIIGSSRRKPVSRVRQIAVYVAKELTGASLVSIGNYLDGRKHTTVLYAYDEIKKTMPFDKKLSEEINTLFNIINRL